MRMTDPVDLAEAIKAAENVTVEVIERAETTLEEVRRGVTTRKKARRTLRTELENLRSV